MAGKNAKFPPDTAAFLQRQEDSKYADRVAAEVTLSHLNAFLGRVAKAKDALAVGHLGTARAFLEIGLRDFQAAIAALPN